MNGDGILSFINGYLNKNKHQNLTDRLVDQLDSVKNLRIVNIWYNRKPVNGGIEKFLNFISLGDFHRQKTRLDIDEIFHAFLIIQLSNLKFYILEKNHVVELKSTTSRNLQNGFRMVLPSISLSVGSIIANAILDKPDLIKYDAILSNCQDFCYQIFISNNIKADSEYIWNTIIKPQDANELLSGLKGELSEVPNLLTNTASYGDKILEKLKLDKLFLGNGIKKNKKKINNLDVYNNKMSSHIQHKMKLSQAQIKKLAQGESIRLKNLDLVGDVPVLLTKTQANKLKKSYMAGSGMVFSMSNKQIKGNGWGSFWKGAVKTVAPIATNIVKDKVNSVIDNSISNIHLIGKPLGNLAKSGVSSGLDLGSDKLNEKIDGMGLKKRGRPKKSVVQPKDGNGIMDLFSW